MSIMEVERVAQMPNLQNLNMFLKERLTLAAQEIFKAVEDVFLEYNEEICRSRKEIQLLKRRLQLTGDQVDSDKQSLFPDSRGQSCSQSFCEEWRDTEMQMKLEVYTQHEEDEAPACNASAAVSLFTDNQTPSKNIDTQLPPYNENSSSCIYHEIQVKVEPEAEKEMNTFQSNENSGPSSKEPMDMAPRNDKTISSHSVTYKPETQPFKMHQSVVLVGAKNPIAEFNCGCNFYRCALCPLLMPMRAKKFLSHWRVHLKNAIVFQDKRLCKCHLPCRNEAHYHCPSCRKTVLRRNTMVAHLERCSQSQPQPPGITSAPQSSLSTLTVSPCTLTALSASALSSCTANTSTM